MSTENTQSSALIVVLSILGILAIALIAGLLLMQKQESGEIDLTTALSSRQEIPAADDFDPISWAREGAAYPPLQEAEDGELITDFNGDQALPSMDNGEIPKPVVIQQPAAVSAPVERAPVERYREITENAFWVQVFSSTDASRAEGIRDDMAAQGMPASVQTREIDGTVHYRVRIGAFEAEDEAEHYAETARKIAGFEQSYVVIAPVTRQIPVDGS